MTVATIWNFRTKNFRVVVDCDYDQDTLDLSWDDTGEVREKIESGEWASYTMRARVLDRDGNELGVDYLGASIYGDPREFRDHIGLGIKSRADGCNYGSYFTDMVRQAIEEARESYQKPRPFLRTPN
jgi:hypothetical protein